MPVTKHDVVKTWARNWTRLKAWRYDLSEAVVVVKDRHNGQAIGSTGRARYLDNQVIVRCGRSVVDCLATVLHEFAHLSERRDGHGIAWQRTFAAAVEEVTGTPIGYGYENKRDIDYVAHIALRDWWKRSGNEFAVQLVLR
jgi:hypothetical protein